MSENSIPCNSAVEPKTTRGLSWTAEEEIQLCKSWIAISADASAGTDQDRDTLWDRIRAHFLLNKKMDSKRTAHSLEQHWGRISLRTGNYVGCIAKAVGFSGENSGDMVKSFL